MYCHKCDKLAFEQEFCTICGTKLIDCTFPCPHKPCDEEVYVTDKFCDGCGKPIQEEAKIFIKKMLSAKE